jgi:hypothetical protein
MRTPPRLRAFAVLIAFAYAAALALIAFWPTPVDKPIEGPIRHAIAWFQAHGAGFVTYPLVESMANVALFVPVGLLLVFILGARRWWLAVGIGAALSIAIELGQHFFLSARFSTINDVFANTAGTITGTAIGLLVLAALRFTDVRRHRRAVGEISMRVPREPQRADATR